MTKDQAIVELVASAHASEIEIVRSWRDSARRLWRISGVMELEGVAPTIEVPDSDIPKAELRFLLRFIGET